MFSVSPEPLQLAISPCPNDTFIFHDWIHRETQEARILPVEATYLDIDQLNTAALEGKYDIIKVSSTLLPLINNAYGIFPIATTIGINNGPRLIIRKERLSPDQLHNPAFLATLRIGIPGAQTTAAFLLKELYPHITNVVEIRYDQAFEKMDADQLDGAVLIHEMRHQFDQNRYHLVEDLGAKWSQLHHAPLFLCAIAIRRSLGHAVLLAAYHALQSSLKPLTVPMSKKKRRFLLDHAKGNWEQIELHLETYITDECYSLSENGFNGIASLLKAYRTDISPQALFILPEFLPRELVE